MSRSSLHAFLRVRASLFSTVQPSRRHLHTHTHTHTHTETETHKTREMLGEEDDDQEEEELLQRALAEQAARDVKYQRPPNYPPPTVSSAASGPPRRDPPRTPPKRAPPKPPPIEDDEESEVELLSISSEEEDESLSRLAALPNTQAKAAVRGKGNDDDDSDLEWNEDEDGEPDSWKMVDQTEMVRRVREMRETKTAPVASAVRLRKSTNVADAIPRGEDLIDPLGLGIIDIRTLTLVPKVKSGDSSPALSAVSSDRGSSKSRGFLRSKKEAIKIPLKDEVESPSAWPELPVVRDHATREKVMYHSEKFDPKFFLARIHQNTGTFDLEAGEEALKQDLQNRKDQLKKLVKENFDCFVSCKNTIDDIHSKLQQIESDKEGAGTIHLSKAIQEVDVVAKHAFAPLLERQAQAERIRSVQGMLQRFRTLFNLPSMIRANIGKGEYDLAIREYKKAKSLVLYSHVGILNRVLEEVDKIVQEFKDMLYKSMEDPHVEISQVVINLLLGMLPLVRPKRRQGQPAVTKVGRSHFHGLLENTIRLLLELEPDSDPVWHYLTIQDRRIRGLLEGCSLEHDARMDALHGRVRERVRSDARWKQLQQESNKTSDVDFTLLLRDNDKEAGESSLKDSTGNESDALLGRLIRRLTAVVVLHVPTFWRLALSIFNGKFAKVTGSANGGLGMPKAGTGPSFDIGQYPFEEVAETKFTSHSLEEVVNMVHCIISLYESKVQNAFLALAEANVLRPYMRQGVAEISKACVALQGKDCAPPSAVQMLLVLRTEVTRVFVLRLCALMYSATSELVNEEDWVPVATVERSASPFAISGLPLRVRDMLVSAMEHLTEMLERLKRDAPERHEDTISQLHQMQDNVRYTFFECFVTLAENLEKLAYELAQVSRDERVGNGNGQEWPGHDKFMGLLAGVEVINPHQRLLMVLSNTGFCNSVLLPELSIKYQHVWSYDGHHEGSKGRGSGGNAATFEEASAALSALEEKILGRYNFAKATAVGTAAAAYLLDDGTQWSASPPVKGIRDAVVELLHPLVSVHAEVYAGAKPFVENVINHIVEGLMDALLNVFTENKTKVLKVLDANGYCQLMLEVEYIEAVLRSYLTGPAHEAAGQLRDLLLEKLLEFVGDKSEAGHSRRSTRGSDDGMGLDERASNLISPEEVQAILQQLIAEYLPLELKRTRINVFCFMEALPEISPEMLGRRSGVLHQHRNRSSGHLAGMAVLNLTRHRRKNSGSSLTDSDSGKPGSGLPPLSPYASYASSEIGSDTGSGDFRTRGVTSTADRFLRGQSDLRRSTRRSTSQIFHNDG